MGVMLDSAALVDRQSPENRFEDVKVGNDVLIETLAVYGDWMETFKANSDETHNLTGESWSSAFWTTILSEEYIQSKNEMDSLSSRQLDLPIQIAKFIQKLPFPDNSNLVAGLGLFKALRIFLFAIPNSLSYMYWPFRGSQPAFVGIENTTGRKMIQTSSGYLGLAPQHTDLGDHVFLLQGGPTYYILREQSREDTYALVGDCYINGLSEDKARELGELRPVWLV